MTQTPRDARARRAVDSANAPGLGSARTLNASMPRSCAWDRHGRLTFACALPPSSTARRTQAYVRVECAPALSISKATRGSAAVRKRRVRPPRPTFPPSRMLLNGFARFRLGEKTEFKFAETGCLGDHFLHRNASFITPRRRASCAASSQSIFAAPLRSSPPCFASRASPHPHPLLWGARPPQAPSQPPSQRQ